MRKPHGKNNFFGGSPPPNPFASFGVLLGDWDAEGAVLSSNIVLSISNNYSEGGASSLISVNSTDLPPAGGIITYDATGWATDGSPALVFATTDPGVYGCELNTTLDQGSVYQGGYTALIVFEQISPIPTNAEQLVYVGPTGQGQQHDLWYNGYFLGNQLSVACLYADNAQSAVTFGNAISGVQLMAVSHDAQNQTVSAQSLFYKNAQPYNRGTTAAVVPSINVVNMGVGVATGAGSSFSGKLKRVLFYKDVLTPQNLASAEALLANLYLPESPP